jgi:hypothetical protein
MFICNMDYTVHPMAPSVYWKIEKPFHLSKTPGNLLKGEGAPENF